MHGRFGWNHEQDLHCVGKKKHANVCGKRWPTSCRKEDADTSSMTRYFPCPPVYGAPGIISSRRNKIRSCTGRSMLLASCLHRCMIDDSDAFLLGFDVCRSESATGAEKKHTLDNTEYGYCKSIRSYRKCSAL